MPAPPPVSAGQAVPEWLLARWRRNFGAEEAERLAIETLHTPKTYLRLNARFDADETLRLLHLEGVETAPAELPLCRVVVKGKPARTECFRQGRIRIQDLGSQRVAPLLGLRAEHRFADLCAAPGGKTFQALEGALPPGSNPESRGFAVACDRGFDRLRLMRSLATVAVPMLALDATRPLPFSGRFDRVLVDVPCSGTGTLKRNPEIKWKLSLADISTLATAQASILQRGLELLAPGGRLIYSTCSLEPEENEQVVDAALTMPCHKEETHLWLPGENQGDGFFACVIES
jgi:16S rRNA (cytosine967-C5)-methyltransferase